MYWRGQQQQASERKRRHGVFWRISLSLSLSLSPWHLRLAGQVGNVLVGLPQASYLGRMACWGPQSSQRILSVDYDHLFLSCINDYTTTNPQTIDTIQDDSTYAIRSPPHDEVADSLCSLRASPVTTPGSAPSWPWISCQTLSGWLLLLLALWQKKKTL